MKVNFIIAGVQKAGTTALYHYLRDHPQVRMAKQKEVHFFDNEQYFSKPNNTALDYSFYHAAFNDEPHNHTSHFIYGEATPIYLYWPEAIARIQFYNPAMKIIVLLRNPIERAYSHWNMEFNRGRELLPFWDAILMEKLRCRQAKPYKNRLFNYLDRGYYSQQIERLWQYFHHSQTLIIKSDDLKNHHEITLKTIHNFLDVDVIPCRARQKFKSIYPTAMTEKERHYLQIYFADEINKLESLLGWDCREWKK